MPLRAACRGGLARSDEWQGPCLVASCVKAGPSRRDSSPGEGRTPLMPPGSTRPRNSQAQLEDLESNDHDEPQLLGSRLLSPEQAAAYLGLRSRFAIYRLVASGRLRALRLANKAAPRPSRPRLDDRERQGREHGKRRSTAVRASCRALSPAPPRNTPAPKIGDTPSDSAGRARLTSGYCGGIRQGMAHTG